MAYLNSISCFDIETSNNGEGAWIVSWQWAIDDKYYSGRDINSLLEFVAKLQKSVHGILITYVHNLNYEWQFIRKYFKWLKVFAGGSRDVYYIRTGRLLFRDSYKLSGASLEKTVEKFAISKLVGGWDYEKIRTPITPLTAQELAYAKQDVTSLQCYIKEMVAKYGSVKNIPLTKTGITRYNLRAYIEDNYSFNGCNGYEGYYYNYIKGNIPSIDILYILRQAYWGGFTHASLFASGRILKNISSYDITSSYPTVMILEKFPQRFYKTDLAGWKHARESGKAIIATYNLYNIESRTGFGYIPIYKNMETEGHIVFDNGKIYKADKVTVVLTEIDLDIILKIYKIGKIEVCEESIYIAPKEYLPDVFRKFILKKYADKTQLKGVAGKEEEYASAKADVNCLYGMTVTDPVRSEFFEQDGDILASRLYLPEDKKKVAKMTEEEYQKYYDEVLDNLPLEKRLNLKKELESKKLKKAYDKKARPVGLYQWGVYVAAYARQNLMKMILKINYCDFVYSDTDSIKFKNLEKYKKDFGKYNKNICKRMQAVEKILEITTAPKTIQGEPKQLGVYDFEWTADKFKTLRAKTYIFEKDGKLNCTVAGIPKKRLKRWLLQSPDPFLAFENDLKIPADFDKETQKLRPRYIDEPFSAIVDGCEVSALSGEILEAVDFEVQPDLDYIALCENLQEIQNHNLFL